MKRATRLLGARATIAARSMSDQELVDLTGIQHSRQAAEQEAARMLVAVWRASDADDDLCEAAA